MRTRRNKFRIGVITAALVAAITGGIITWRQTDSTNSAQTKEKENSSASVSSETETENGDITAEVPQDPSMKDMPQRQDAAEETSGEAKGEKDVKKEVPDPSAGSETAENGGEQNEAQNTQEPSEENSVETAGETVGVELNFNEGTVLELPVSGSVVIPYNMKNTVYFPTLDLYQCNPGVVLSAEVGTPVLAVANSQVVSVADDVRTGKTVTMNMGNGYQAVYGQLGEVSLEAGQTVEAGAPIGTIAEPTKYFVKEGSNLFFELKKDGESVDPMMYLPPETE